MWDEIVINMKKQPFMVSREVHAITDSTNGTIKQMFGFTIRIWEIYLAGTRIDP
jgi:hypothetical protein